MHESEENQAISGPNILQTTKPIFFNFDMGIERWGSDLLAMPV